MKTKAALINTHAVSPVSIMLIFLSIIGIVAADFVVPKQTEKSASARYQAFADSVVPFVDVGSIIL